MSEHPYHHGNLRATLLTAAEHTLRTDGLDQVSLRALARAAGVSHGAPRRHFADRQALLDALAEAGFARLSDEVEAAVKNAGPDFPGQLRAVGAAFVRFAIEDTALMDLMFTSKNAGPPGAMPAAPARLFTTVGDLIRRGQQAGQLPPGDPERLRLLLMATVQGITALITSGHLAPGQADALITDAVQLFTGVEGDG